MSINGEVVEPSLEDGYVGLERSWKNDEVSLEFPMAVRKVVADPKVTEDQGKIALEYGPFVYAFEGGDQRADRIDPSADFVPKMESGFLGGVVTFSEGNEKAVPYYSRSNRGAGKMKVWMPVSAK